MDNLEFDLVKVNELLEQGRKLEAVKIISENKKIDLKTAKDIVDKIAASKSENLINLNFSETKKGNLEFDLEKVNELLKQGRKLEAVKIISENKKIDLKTAKDIVDKIAASKSEDLVNLNFSETKKGNLEFVLVKVTELVKQGSKLEAVKIIRENTTIDLKTAKDIVDKIAASKSEDLINLNFSETKNESCKISKFGDKIDVKYTDLNGVERIVTPLDTSWSKVKELMKNDLILEEYENSFYNQNKTSSRKPNFIEYEKEKPWKLYLVVAILLFGIYYLYYMSKH